MGIRLKTLLIIFILLGVHAFYYFALPRIIDLEKLSPIITKIIKKESGYNIKFENLKFKNALSPAIWLKADKIAVLNDDNSEAFYVEKPMLKVSLIPLIIGKINLKYFSSDMIFADIYADKSLKIRLGQYVLEPQKNMNLSINGASVFVDKYLINFTNTDINSKVVLNGSYFNIDKYIENKVLKTSLDATISSKALKSRISLNLDTKLPFNKHLDKYPPEIAMTVTNLQMSEFSGFIKAFSNGNISDISGLINLDIHSDKKILDQKQYVSNIVAENLKCTSKYFEKPYSYSGKMQLNSHLLLEKNVLTIPSISFKTSKFSAKLSGSIDKITSKNPVPDFDLRILNAQAKDLLDLIPYCPILDKLVRINISVAKDANFNADVNVNLKIKDKFIEPMLFGKIIIDNAYVFEPIKKAPRGGNIAIEYKGDYLELDVNVPTEPTQEVNVKGTIKAYGDLRCDLHITSTPLIDLTLAKKVLVPVHRTFDFLIGPVPIMEFAGYGSIDLVVKGTRKEPHAFGWFKAQNATVYFDDVKNFVLKDANALLTFNDFDTKFTLIKGTVNGKPLSLEGVCNLDGVFDFKAKTSNQDLNSLLIILKTSPMLEPVSKSIKIIDSASGLADLSLQLKGHLKNISELEVGKNVHAQGELKLLSNSIKLSDIDLLLQNIIGNINFNEFEYKLNLVSKISNAKILISGIINKDKASISFDSDKIMISDAIKTFKNPYVAVIPQKNTVDNSYFQVKGQYNGSISNIDFSKIKVDGFASFKNLNLISKKNKMPIKVISGSGIIKDGVLTIKALNTSVGTMPALIYGTIENIYKKPKLNLSINAKPNQKFVEFAYNRNVIYPVKIKGNVSLNAILSGFIDNVSVNSSLKIGAGSSIYYMGATIGDANLPILLTLNAICKPNQLNIKSFIYDKIVYSGKKVIRERQLSSNGQLVYGKNDVYFKNFEVKTNVHTDMRIFNIVFKKPLIKKGIFTSDIIVNGSLSNPLIKGNFNIYDMDIPFFDANIENISLKLTDSKILAIIKGAILTNKFSLDLNAKNSLKAPFVINSATLDIGNFNVDHILDMFNKIEINSSREITANSNDLSIVNFNQILINKFDIIANSINLDNINAKDLLATMSLKNGKVNLEKFKFKLAKGTLDGSGGYDLHLKKSNFDLYVSDVDADSLLSSMLDVKGQLYGDLSGQLNLTCSGVDQADCLKTLNGNGAFIIKDGRMPKLGSLEYLLKAGNLIKSGITGLSINGIIDLITPLKTGNFASIKGSIEIHDGVADKIQILSTGKDLNIFITGEYNFSNYIANMYVFGRLSKKISTVLGPIGNVSLNTLFSAIPGVDLNDPSNTKILNDLNKIPMFELSNKAFRVFAVEIFGDINGDNYVQSFRWVE